MQTQALLAAAGLAACAAITSAQSNDITMSNGGDTLFFYSDPSAPGDLYWRALPGDRLLAHQHGPAGDATMELSGFYEDLFDTDWSTTPVFFDRHVGRALPVAGAPCALEPDFLQTGVFAGTTVVMGPSGFASPCTVAPSLCSPGGCAAPGFTVLGWIVDISLGSTPGSGVVLPADGTPASDAAVTYLVTPGMPASGGPCGLGDYVLQTAYSFDESQADDCAGLNTFSGSRLGSGPAAQDPLTDTPTFALGWREPVLNVVADSGTGLGVEQGPNGGGALNGLKLDTQSGVATVGVEVRDFEGVGDLAYVWSAAEAGGPPGMPIGGAWLLQRFSRVMPACFLGTIGPATFVFTAEGAFTTCQMPQLPVAGPVDLYWQGLMHNTLTGEFRNTNRVRTTLY
jgi:hypothetical protein